MNYFEIFGIPLQLKVDKNELPKKFFELSRKFHPDYYANTTPSEQNKALEITANLNKAFKTFQNPEDTIKYVLQLKGLLEEEEKYQLPPEFLMEMMELNEELSENSAQQINEIEKGLYALVEPIIENYDDTTGTTSDLLKLKEYYYKKKYLQRILDRIAG